MCARRSKASASASVRSAKEARPAAPPDLSDFAELAAACRRLAGDPVLGRFHAGHRRQEAFGGQAALEQLAHRRRPAGHTLLEAEIVDHHQLFRAEHDLQTLASESRRFYHDQMSPSVSRMLVRYSLFGKSLIALNYAL